jgi:hypothetical protein
VARISHQISGSELESADFHDRPRRTPNIVRIRYRTQTFGDDKDHDDEVTVEILLGGEVLAAESYAKNVTFSENSDQPPRELQLSRPVPLDQSNNALQFRISLNPTTDGWDMGVSLFVILEDQVTTLEAGAFGNRGIGDDNPAHREEFFRIPQA